MTSPQELVVDLNYYAPFIKYEPSFNAGSVGLDLPVQDDYQIVPGDIVLVDTEIVINFPQDVWGLLVARSSLHKRGLVLVNGAGIIDMSYQGEKDTLKVALLNITSKVVELKAGERIAQLVLVPAITINSINKQEEHWNSDNRGGFGSTGV